MKVIIVEDNPDHQLIIKTKLTSHYKNIRIDATADVESAQKLLSDGVYDVLLLDYRLEGANGIDLVNWIHEKKIETPITMITGAGEVEVAVKAIKLGVYDYLCKNTESFDKLPFLLEKVVKEHALKKKLNEAEFKYRTLVEGMNEAVFLMKSNGQFLYVSSSVERLLGYSDTDIRDNFLSHFSDSDKDSFLNNISLVSSGMSVDPFVLSFTRGDGESVYIEINASQFAVDGEQKGVIGTIQDVTKHVLLEREIESERKKIIDIFNSMIDWVYVVDEKYNIQFMNKTLAKQIGGLNRDKCYTILYKRNKPCPYCKWEGTKKELTMRWEMRVEDGKTFDVISSPLKNPDGSVYRMVILRDITKKKEVEEKYRQMSEETLKANRELKSAIEQLKQTQEQLIQSEKLAAIGKLVAGVAHELNNPLFSAMGYAELLAMESESSEGQRDKIENILESIRRARSIVRDLLKFARRENVEKENISFNDVIRETLSLRHYEHKVNDIEVICELADDLPPVFGNFVRLQQVVLNILINAEQALVEAGKIGSIRVKTSLDKTGEWIISEIADNGIGIKQDIIGKIFDPFFTTKEVGKGTGLGLSTSYGIVKDHSGQLLVRQEKGWTIFTISLPAVMEEKGTVAEEEYHEQDVLAKGEKILVVDDEPVIVQLLEDFFRRKGFQVISAISGSDALEILSKSTVELIITDIKMPQMDGTQFYEEIKGRNPKLLERLIFITGDTLNLDTRRFLKETRAHFLKKPFSFNEIMNLIDRIRKRTAQRELF